MKKILVLFAIVLGLTGCQMNVAPTNAQLEMPQNKVQWVSNGSRTATTLEYVTLEVYKVPNRNGKFIHSEKEYVETKTLHRGEVLTFPSMEDYDYKYITSIKCVEFDTYNVFYATRDEINIFDYENTVGMESSHYYACKLRTPNTECFENDAGHKIWKKWSGRILYRDDLEGYENYYYFLDKNVMEKFYDEHKDGERIVWNN